ncbi:MAG: two-component system chemotaxis sensor kinase CheA [Candidatus Endobugula sp.]|jgi:two-component system chemotaxis sensor kinase CheA
MSFADDEEILQDFLVEAGEILEQLSEQLVDLEQRPDDKELLNAIFRGFHTVKGGAGFLQLNTMVECCHVTENLFDILRNGQRGVTSELMDVVLQALDAVNAQFEAVHKREEPQPATPELLATLGRLVACEDLNDDSEAEAVSEEPEAVEESVVTGAPGDDITDGEFEQLVDAVSDAPSETPKETTAATAAPAPVVNNDSNEISDDEFEKLLDQLHGKGQGPTAVIASAAADNGSNANTANTAKKPPAVAASSVDANVINDDEFEDLLDQLHGKGNGPSAATGKVSTPPPAVKASVTAAAVSPKDKSKSKAKATPKDQPKAAAPVKASAPAAPAKEASAPVAETTVRVDTQRLDDIMNMVGELVLVRNRLVRLGDASTNEALGKAVANLDVVTADLQTSVMKTRMQPIKKVFGRFPRVVRDLARNLKKEISLELVGEETDLDKNLVEALADPLVHLVRNSVDHGIEMPEVRVSNGKDKVGRVILAAQQEGDHILLSITDDGGGMDANKLREIAVAKGLMDQDAAQRLSDVEAFNLIFAPGFSTKTEISDVSGRGVGMDVVKTKIMQLNGSIEIESEMGKGTKILIKVPLTLAIMPTLMIMLGAQAFALPLVSVNEIFHMDLKKVNIVDGQECISIREQAVPLFYLKNWLVDGAANFEKPTEAHVVIVTVGTQRVGFVVDQLIGQEEVVIKPLGKMLHGTPGMAGATITGDGTIALILDVPSMLQRYAGTI